MEGRCEAAQGGARCRANDLFVGSNEDGAADGEIVRVRADRLHHEWFGSIVGSAARLVGVVGRYNRFAEDSTDGDERCSGAVCRLEEKLVGCPPKPSPID